MGIAIADIGRSPPRLKRNVREGAGELDPKDKLKRRLGTLVNWSFDRDVGDVRAPDLVWTLDGETAQQMRELMCPGAAASAQGRAVHLAHYTIPARLLDQHRGPLPATVRSIRGEFQEWPRGEQFVGPPLRAIVVDGRARWLIPAESRDTEQLGLAADRKPAMGAVHEAV